MRSDTERASGVDPRHRARRAETDDQAREDCIRHEFGGLMGILAPRMDSINSILPAMMEVGAAYGGAPPPMPATRHLCRPSAAAPRP